MAASAGISDNAQEIIPESRFPSEQDDAVGVPLPDSLLYGAEIGRW
jgi:hypothetical protein